MEGNVEEGDGWLSLGEDATHTNRPTYRKERAGWKLWVTSGSLGPEEKEAEADDAGTIGNRWIGGKANKNKREALVQPWKPGLREELLWVAMGKYLNPLSYAIRSHPFLGGKAGRCIFVPMLLLLLLLY